MKKYNNLYIYIRKIKDKYCKHNWIEGPEHNKFDSFYNLSFSHHICIKCKEEVWY